MKYVVGIDEAGRGPLAGPVAVGAVKVREGFDKRFWKGIRDSKKLSLSERELWFGLMLEAKKKGELDFAVVLVSEKVIDRKGIAEAIRIGIRKCLVALDVPEDSQIFLDGGIKAPENFIHQKTVVKGDEKIPIISLASIAAKVTRDRRMLRLSKKFPEFDFHVHKGYGTLKHRLAIRTFGLTSIHRRSFLGRLISGSNGRRGLT